MTIRKISRHGRSFTVDTQKRYDWMWSRYQDGKWEPETFFILDRFLRVPGSYYIDIGAYVGPTVLYAAALGARVLAFDPDPVAFAALQENVQLNPALQSLISCANIGLTNADGWRRFYSYRLGNSETTIYKTVERSRGLVEMTESIECQVADAATKAKDYHFGDADLIKIDAEGSEYDIIPALKDLLEERQPTLYLSLHPQNLGVDLPESSRAALRSSKSLELLSCLDRYNVFTCSGSGVFSQWSWSRLIENARTTGLAGQFVFTALTAL